MPVSASPKNDTTLREFGQMMRNDFNRGLRDGNLFSHLKTVWEGVHRPWRRPTAPGVAIEMSSMGPVRLSGPVKDAFVTLTCHDKGHRVDIAPVVPGGQQGEEEVRRADAVQYRWDICGGSGGVY